MIRLTSKEILTMGDVTFTLTTPKVIDQYLEEEVSLNSMLH